LYEPSKIKVTVSTLRSLPVLWSLLDVHFATQAEHNTNAKYKYRIKTSKNNKKEKETDSTEQSTNTSIQKVQNYTLFKQTTKVNVNKLLHSIY